MMVFDVFRKTNNRRQTVEQLLFAVERLFIAVERPLFAVEPDPQKSVKNHPDEMLWTTAAAFPARANQG